jgi:DNA modification methylase
MLAAFLCDRFQDESDPQKKASIPQIFPRHFLLREEQNMKNRKLDIEYVSVASLKFNPHNPRVHTTKQIDQIARSIQTFGFNVPVLIDSNSQVIAGHGRVLACKDVGFTDVPAVRVNHLSPTQIQAFTIADNRLTENGSWDERLLGEQLKILSEADLDFSLDVIGFEVAEIDLFIENLTSNPEGTSDPGDTLPAVSAIRVSEVGDVWVLGKHRVLCGNAVSRRTYEVLMNSQKADMVFTDPPYNVPISGHVSGNGRHTHREFVMGTGEMSEDEFNRFLRDIFTELARFSQDPSLHYICMDWRHMMELLEAGQSAFSELKNLCVWVKDNAGLGSFYRSQHELIFVFQKGASPQNNVQLGRFGRSRTNIWRYPGANSFARTSQEGDLLAMHPTVKPVALVADAILDCTSRGDVVLDPFLGSGTTVIAAERTGRVCYGMELDPAYIDTIVRRWQRFTTQSAVHLKTGQSFNDLEKEAANVGRI